MSNSKDNQFISTETVQKLHKSRRAFFIIDGHLFINKENSELSHLQWLLDCGFSDIDADFIMQNNCRGMLKDDKIYFYIGYDHSFNEQIKTEFIKFLPELKTRLNLSPETEILAGMIVGEIGELWQPKKRLGTIKDFVK